MSSILSFSAGKKAKFAVVAVWILIMVVIGPLAGKFEGAQNNEASSFLPKGAESVEALEVSRGFPSGETIAAVTVFANQDGLTQSDRKTVSEFRSTLNQKNLAAAQPTLEATESPDGTTAFLTTRLSVGIGESDQSTEAVSEIREQADQVSGDLQVEVTGDAALLADQEEVFEGINGSILLFAAGLVLILLVIIYRSPIFWIIPFFAVVLAEVASRGMGYLLAEAGVTINGQTGGILPVLVFGAGTDYALLLVARYREELRKFENRHDAMATALRKAGPAIVASAGTVCAGLITLALADVAGTAALGPVGAAGVALAAVVTLTFLPAVLLICGRRAFWPFIPRYGSEGTDEAHGVWRRVGDWIATGPRRVWIGSSLVLVIGMLGLLQVNSDLTSGGSFREDVESVEGQQLLSEALPPGSVAPSQIVVTDPSQVQAVRQAVEAVEGVASTGEIETGRPGAQFRVVLDANPFGQEGFDLIGDVREAAHAAAPDPGVVLVGGPTAQEEELRTSASRDNLVVIPVALLIVTLILVLLLRSIVAPILLVGTVIVSFGAALGIGVFFFENVFGFQGLDPTLPVLSFVFLVALGVDYNIFLMARAREETENFGPREGVIRALAVTGTVITSAGVVLAGTFAVLTIFPLVFLFELGFVISIGVLIDTFLVRSILVPAAVMDLGGKTWWPSALAHKKDTPEGP